MKDFDDLLIELGTEELPPKALAKLSKAFHQGVEQGLKKAELTFDDIRPYATPRRLALVISKLHGLPGMPGIIDVIERLLQCIHRFIGGFSIDAIKTDINLGTESIELGLAGAFAIATGRSE